METAWADRLAGRIRDYVLRAGEVLVGRFMPELQVPRWLAGYAIPREQGIELVWLLGHLRWLGVDRFAGLPVDAAVARLLEQVDGRATETFLSYRVGEAVLEWGPFAGNELLARLSAEQVEQVRLAVDSTHIVDQWGKPLGGRPNNYWCVLARCEHARWRLGLLAEPRDDGSAGDALYRRALTQAGRLLRRNPLGFFDDRDRGTFDIYSADVQVFCHPLAAELDALDPAEGGGRPCRDLLAAHVRLAERIGMENGASVCWGRSTGALSVCITMELFSLGLLEGVVSDTSTALGRIEHAFEQFDRWMSDGLTSAHRGRAADSYRGPVRLLQMSVDLLGKLAETARTLRMFAAGLTAESAAQSPAGSACPEPAVDGGTGSADGAAPEELFAARDEWISFGDRTAGVWIYRSPDPAGWRFQLAVTAHPANSDYVAWPRCPGVLDNPACSEHLCGVPRVLWSAHAGCSYAPLDLPAEICHEPGALRLRFEQLQRAAGKEGPETVAARREVCWRVVEPGRLVCEERLLFEQVPQAVYICIPESGQRLSVELVQGSGRVCVVEVLGIPAWLGVWGENRRVHELHLVPAREMRFTYAIALG